MQYYSPPPQSNSGTFVKIIIVGFLMLLIAGIAAGVIAYLYISKQSAMTPLTPATPKPQPQPQPPTPEEETKPWTPVTPDLPILNFGPTSESSTGPFCDFGNSSITCPAGTNVNIVSGFYGRDGKNVCMGVGSEETGCNLPTATQDLRKWCTGKQVCSFVSAENSENPASTIKIFSEDPCPGVEKYFYGTYTCANPANVGGSSVPIGKMNNTRRHNLDYEHHY